MSLIYKCLEIVKGEFQLFLNISLMFLELRNKITDRIVQKIKEWHQRSIEHIYSFVFMDAIYYKVMDDGRIINLAVYVVLGVTIDGYKDILGI